MASALLLLAGAPVAAQTTIGTPFVPSTSFDAVTAGCYRATCGYFGQVFTVPTAATRLSSFSMGLLLAVDRLRPTPYDARLSLVQWDSNLIAGTGPQLVAALGGATRSFFGPQTGQVIPTRFTWSFSQTLDLTPGRQYLAYLTTPTELVRTGGSITETTDARASGFGGSPYADGYMVRSFVPREDYAVGGPPVSGWQPFLGADAHFSADFVPVVSVPQPPAWLLLASALLGLGMAVRLDRSIDAYSARSATTGSPAAARRAGR